MDDDISYSIALWENPYFGIEQKLYHGNIGIFSQNYSTITSVLSIAWISTLFLN